MSTATVEAPAPVAAPPARLRHIVEKRAGDRLWRERALCGFLWDLPPGRAPASWPVCEECVTELRHREAA